MSQKTLLLIIFLISAVCFANSSIANTEISGEVFGEWTSEGSPYLVIDSTWVPEAERLTIESGVEVIVNSNTSITIYGVLYINGSVDDSVRIHGEDNGDSWSGMYLQNPHHSQDFNFVSILDCNTCLILGANQEITLNHCRLIGENQAIIAEDWELSGQDVFATGSEIVSRHEEPTIEFDGRFEAETTRIECGIDGRALRLYGSFILDNCEVVGISSIQDGSVELIDCCSFRYINEDVCSGGISMGDLSSATFNQCIIEGELVFVSEDNRSTFEVNDCLIEDRLYTRNCLSTITNNVIGSDWGMGCLEIAGSGTHIVRDNQIYSGMICSSVQLVRSFNNTMNTLQIACNFCEFEGNTIDSLLGIWRSTSGVFSNNNISGELAISSVEEIEFSHNLITATIVIDGSDADFTQNTIITPVPIENTIWASVSVINESNLTLNSNIIIGRPAIYLLNLNGNYDEQVLDLHHNIFYNYNYYLDRMHYSYPEPVEEDIFNETNLITNPFLWQMSPLNPVLQAISPCIDNGDPELPVDPDNTQADIGAYFFDQRFNHPPGIHSSALVYAQRGKLFEYTAYSSDEESIGIYFSGLPEWLESIERDMNVTIDSVLLAGIAPADQQDFSFTVIAEDSDEQVDSLLVSVKMTDYHPLSGDLPSVIREIDSPYYLWDNTTVPFGDTVLVEPGCEFIIRTDVEVVRERLRMDVLGTLILEGTEEDSITFRTESVENVLDRWNGIRYFMPGAVCDIEYTQFINAIRSIFVNKVHSLTISHSSFHDETVDLCQIVSISNTDEININNCRFSDLLYLSHSGSAIVNNNFFDVNGSCRMFDLRKVIFENHYIGSESTGPDFNHIDTLSISNLIIDSYRYGMDITDCTIVKIDHSIFYNRKLYAHLVNGILQITNCTFSGTNQAAISYLNYDDALLSINYSNFYGFDSILSTGNNEPRYEFGDGIISVDPLFVDAENNDFSLQVESPLIDAGDPNSPPDPDGSRADIGANCCSDTKGTNIDPVLIGDHCLDLSYYPNPCNSTLCLNYLLPAGIDGKISLYDATGRTIETIFIPAQGTSNHGVLFRDATRYASGTYFVTLQTKDKNLRKSLIILK